MALTQYCADEHPAPKQDAEHGLHHAYLLHLPFSLPTLSFKTQGDSEPKDSRCLCQLSCRHHLSTAFVYLLVEKTDRPQTLIFTRKHFAEHVHSNERVTIYWLPSRAKTEGFSSVALTPATRAVICHEISHAVDIGNRTNVFRSTHSKHC